MKGSRYGNKQGLQSSDNALENVSGGVYRGDIGCKIYNSEGNLVNTVE